MSGIFNGDSIYKTGGGGGSGGGGYIDGGELVDADYIEVLNNSVSSYENTSRGTVNFYFDIAEGEIINSVIQLTTQVNATINVYYVRNGIYYLLGNTNGNTVNANEDYEITCTGNSFEIEQVNDLSEEPVMADFGDRKIWVFPFGDYLISEDLGGWYSYNEFNNLIAGTGWSKVTSSIMASLRDTYGINAIRSDNGWNNTQGTNSTGLDFYPYGYYEFGSYLNAGNSSWFWGEGGGTVNALIVQENTTSGTTMTTEYEEVKVRGRVMKKYKNL